MKIVALEEHFIMPKEEQSLPPGAHRGSDREGRPLVFHKGAFGAFRVED